MGLGAPKLPIPGKRNVLITSALPYVNDVPHLGDIIGGVLSADVFARYCRLRGYNAAYICGTDDKYGAATKTNLEENSSPQESCDKYHAIHKQVYEWFNISFDKFGRSSSAHQTDVYYAIFTKLLQNGCICDNSTLEMYCITCGMFLNHTEWKCKARDYNFFADCKQVCKSPPSLCYTSPNLLFLDLPLLNNKLVEYYKRVEVAWSQNAIQATVEWFRTDFRPREITRDLESGVPVKHDNLDDKVFYVCFDAPLEYISITKCYTPDWELWWKNPKDVELYQFLGKDSVPFHTVMFPSTLLGTGENWTLMKHLSVTESLNYEGGKFSKSEGVGVFGNDAKDTNIPVEVWRHYLLTNRPEVSDKSFTWADLKDRVNNKLLNNLGNFINTVLSFVAKPSGQGYDFIIPDAPQALSDPLTIELAEKVGDFVGQYVKAMEEVKLKQGLDLAMRISSEGNAYVQNSQFWHLYTVDKPRCSIVMRTSVGLVHLLARLLEPFMPSFSIEVFKQLNLPPETQMSLCDDKGDIVRASRPWEIIPSGHKIGKPEPLFRRLEDEEVDSLRIKFAGSEQQRKSRLSGIKLLPSAILKIIEENTFIPSQDEDNENDNHSVVIPQEVTPPVVIPQEVAPPVVIPPPVVNPSPPSSEDSEDDNHPVVNPPPVINPSPFFGLPGKSKVCFYNNVLSCEEYVGAGHQENVSGQGTKEESVTLSKDEDVSKPIIEEEASNEALMKATEANEALFSSDDLYHDDPNVAYIRSLLDSIPAERTEFLTKPAMYEYLKGKVLTLTLPPGYQKEAEAHLLKAVKRDQSIADAWRWLGYCYWDKKDLAMANDYLKEALSKCSVEQIRLRRDILRDLSTLHTRLSEGTPEPAELVEESINYAKQALELDANDSHSLHCLADCFWNKKDLAMANYYLKEALSKCSDEQIRLRRKILCDLSTLHTKLGQGTPERAELVEESINYANEALKLDFKDNVYGNACYTSYLVNDALDKLERSQRAYQIAEKDEQVKSDPEFMFNRTIVLMYLGNYEVVLENFETALKDSVLISSEAKKNFVKALDKVMELPKERKVERNASKYLKRSVKDLANTDSKKLVCRVQFVIKIHERLPPWYLVFDQEQKYYVLCLNSKKVVIEEEVNVTLLDPFIKEHNFSWEGKVYNFKSIRVEQKKMFVNGV